MIPKSFSFLSNPDQALEVLDTLASLLRDNQVGNLHFDHSECESLDLCASAVMDVLFVQGQRNARLHHRSIIPSGYFSPNDDVNVLLKVNGILRAVNHPSSQLVPQELKERLKIFHLKRGFRTPPEQSSETERTSTDLVDFFNSCLGTEGYRLQEQKQRTLIDLIAEVLGNSEEHSGPVGATGGPAWYAIGFYRGSGINGSGGECHLVLFNFGWSIFESLKSPDTSDVLKSEISGLADRHRAAGFFDIVFEYARGLILANGRFWQEDALWTLYALQEGVSRLRHQPGNEDRGNGTIRMIQFFSELAPNGPQMVLLSGRTWIKFDGTYNLGTIMKPGGQRKIMAFNSENDLSKPPDPNFVRTLGRRFPGTLVSLKFILRREDLAKIHEGLDENEDSRFG